jgi:thiol:disulfide interchange protein DsbD
VRTASVIAVLTLVTTAMAQPGRPSAIVVANPAVVDAFSGKQVAVSLRVTLPKGIHVQAHKPDDPLLIPTVVTVTPPKGVTVAEVKYPAATPLQQAGRTETLQVLGPEFAIDVLLAVDATVKPGEIEVPVLLRYQACNDTTCFPPARASAAWRLNVRSSR